jgi:cell division protein FtsI (penicillin-binding protein 3)
MITRQAINNNGRFIILFIAAFWLLFVARAVQVQIIDGKKFREYADHQQNDTMPLAARRGTIYDCKGRPLAYDVEVKSYSVSPRHMSNQDSAAIKLSAITGKSKSYWLQQFKKRPGYLMVERRVSQEMAYKFDKSEISTLHARSETQRIYPYGDLAIEVVGRTDVDNKGIFGLEKYYDNILAGIDGQSIYLRDAYGREITAWEHTLVLPANGSDVYLALDVDMQEIVEDELRMKLDSCGAKWGTAIFIDAQTGGVLACANIEDNAKFKRARSIVDMNEPGSTAKLIPLATVFKERICEPDDIVNVEGGSYVLGKHLIKDDHAHGLLKCSEIGVYSSNIGAAKLGLRAGADQIYKTLIQLGFGTKTGIDFPGETPGAVFKPETWSQHELAIICFGYGVMASALQVAMAYGVVATGGDLLKPYFAAKMVTADSAERILNSKVVVRKALDERTVRILDGIFRDVVQIGTAKKAMDEICVIAGKTGTAKRLKEGGGGYAAGKALASFTGYFPADNPKIMGLVMFDEPTTSIYGGDVSAPVFKNVAKRYGLMPSNNMFVNYRPKPKDNKMRMANGSNGSARMVKLSQKRSLNGGSDANQRKEIESGFHDFTGLTVRDAIRKAKSLGLVCKITGSGRIVTQNPPAGADTIGVAQVELVGETQ